jgi:hypothetical protein
MCSWATASVLKGPSCSFRPLSHVTATYQKPSAFFRAYEIGGETRSVLLSIQLRPENVMEAKIAPRSPHRRGRQTKQAKARRARRLGSWSVFPDDVGFSREVQYSAGLMRYLNSRIQSCYCAPIIWVFAPKNRETERVTLAMDDGRGLSFHRSPRYYREREFLPGPRDSPMRGYLPSRNPGFIYCELVHKGRCAMWRMSNTE